MTEVSILIYACGVLTLSARAGIAIAGKRIKFSASLFAFLIWPILLGFKDGRKFMAGIIIA